VDGGLAARLPTSLDALLHGHVPGGLGWGGRFGLRGTCLRLRLGLNCRVKWHRAVGYKSLGELDLRRLCVGRLDLKRLGLRPLDSEAEECNGGESK
jgi:hypothetical protein